jgi:hypothetical protein
MCAPHDSRFNRQPYSAQEREGKRESEDAVVVPTDEASSMEIVIASDLFPLYRASIYTRLLGGETLTKKAAIYDEAMKLKKLRGYGSSQTTRRYLNELSAASGPFKLEWDQVLGWLVKLRERKK